MSPTDLSRQLLEARRSALVMLALAVLLPAGCQVPFARQARKLDALADHGVPVEAKVSRIDGQGTVHLDYVVGGVAYAGSVRRDEAPSAVPGASVAVAVLPEHPATLVVGEPSRALARAAYTRAFADKLSLGLFWFFGFGGGMGFWQYDRMRQTGRTERDDPARYRTRLALTAVWIAPLLLVVLAYHASDAQAKGEPAWIVPAATLFSLGILGGTGFFVLREGTANAAARAAIVAKWCVPLALVVGLARLLVWLIAS